MQGDTASLERVGRSRQGGGLLLAGVTRVEGVDLGQLLLTRLEKLLLKLGIVPLDRVLVCDCKKVKGSKISQGPSRLDGKRTRRRWMGEGVQCPAPTSRWRNQTVKRRFGHRRLLGQFQ